MPLDNAQLSEIQRDADEINRELRRVVWNGQLMAQSRSGDRLRLKAVLNQVNVAGYRTRERVSMAVRDLYRTSLARARHQTRDLAKLASEIMDSAIFAPWCAVSTHHHWTAPGLFMAPMCDTRPITFPPQRTGRHAEVTE